MGPGRKAVAGVMTRRAQTVRSSQNLGPRYATEELRVINS